MGKSSWVRWWVVCACAFAGVGLLASSALAASSPARYDRLGNAPAAQRLVLVFPLRARLNALERFSTEVNTPGSPLYGQFESIPMLARRFGATLGDEARVTGFLQHAGATHIKVDATGLFVDASLSVGTAQRLFGTQLARYEGPRRATFVAPSRVARLPVSLRGAATGVVGLDTEPLVSSQFSATRGTGFPRTAAVFRKQQQPSGYSERTGTASGCTGALAQRGFTPNQYLTAYDYNALHGAGVEGQGERVALIEIDGFKYTDLQAFAQCFGLPVPAVNAYGVNLRQPLAPGGETTLDLQVLDSAAPELKAVDVYESLPRSSDVLVSLTAPLQNRGRTPEVISASLGVCEPALKLAIGESGIRSVEGALAFATASGISVLASSGDTGSSSCIGRAGPLHMLSVNFPASSPYVTGVGGTNFALNAANQITAQVGWNDSPYDISAGGGGRSILFKRPGYQKGFMRRDRRGVPDVSMLADVLPGYDIYCTVPECEQASGGTPWTPVGGTSAASPLLAGGLALIDQLLRAHGRQELGVANNLLYRAARHDASAGVFDDITEGNNDLGAYLEGNRRPLHCCSAGRGYDLDSGLGTVDIGRLAVLALRLQPRVARVGLSLPRQRPVRRHHLLARVSCSRRCIVGAEAIVGVAGEPSFDVFSRGYVMRRRGRRQVELKFSRGQESELRGALRHHRKIVAFIQGVTVDSGGNLEAKSRGRFLRIRH